MLNKFLYIPTPLAAISASWWLPSLKDLSTFSADILPTCGVILMFLQGIVAVLAAIIYFQKIMKD